MSIDRSLFSLEGKWEPAKRARGRVRRKRSKGKGYDYKDAEPAPAASSARLPRLEEGFDLSDPLDLRVLADRHEERNLPGDQDRAASYRDDARQVEIGRAVTPVVRRLAVSRQPSHWHSTGMPWIPKVEVYREAQKIDPTLSLREIHDHLGRREKANFLYLGADAFGQNEVVAPVSGGILDPHHEIAAAVPRHVQDILGGLHGFVYSDDLLARLRKEMPGVDAGWLDRVLIRMDNDGIIARAHHLDGRLVGLTSNAYKAEWTARQRAKGATR